MNPAPDERDDIGMEPRLGQLGMEVRQSKQTLRMKLYIELLWKEVEMTQEFLEEDD